MAEDVETGAESGGLAFNAALHQAAGSEEARVLLRKQARLVDLQIADLEREDKVRHWSLRVRHVSDVLKLAFELAAAAVVTAIVLFIAGAVWSAVHDNGLVIEAFDVPADFSQHGLTGKMLAGQLVDRLAQMQDTTDSARPAASYRNNWGNDIKVQIPDAGISIGEFVRSLHEWLGHQTRISGELYRTPGGIAVTAHIGDRSATRDGQESSLGTLLQKTAEAVYGQTQPYRYATYLGRHGRVAESVEVLRRLSSDSSPVERAWAFIGLANHQDDIGDIHGALAYFATAQAQLPDFLMPVWDAQFDDEIFGHDEAVVAKGRKLLEALKAPNPYISERARAMMVQIIFETQSSELADFNDVIAHAQLAEALPDYQNGVEDGRQDEIAAYGFLHDPASMHRRLNQLPPTNDANRAGRLTNLAVGEFMSERWQDAARDFGAVQTAVDRLGPGFSVLAVAEVWPYLAMADAAMGDRAHADALVAKMPLDCMWCAIARGRVDELDGKSGGASYWFSNAEKQAPSVPYPDLYWGAMLLHRGDYGDAISKLARAHEKGPHFADPLEMWGEALMRENRSDLALAKFSEAAQYAPHWGRLHLKWGEALFYAGMADEARKQFALAAGFDLTPDDKAELAQMRAAHG